MSERTVDGEGREPFPVSRYGLDTGLPGDSPILRRVLEGDMTTAPIFLVGMMGAGKSTVGPELAKQLDRAFVDTDEVISSQADASIPEIFAREGEAGFRAREIAAIDACAGRAIVVALGGGAIAQPGAAQRIARLGPSVYLRVGVDSLLERIGDGATRPLLRGLSQGERRAKLEALVAERSPSYAAATVAVDCDGLSVAEIVERIVEGLVQIQWQRPS